MRLLASQQGYARQLDLPRVFRPLNFSILVGGGDLVVPVLGCAQAGGDVRMPLALLLQRGAVLGGFGLGLGQFPLVAAQRSACALKTLGIAVRLLQFLELVFGAL